MVHRSEAIGSARWLAPEVTLDTPEFTEKSDVFSVGMVLCEIASREIPFSLLQDVQVIYMIQQGKRPPIPHSCPFILTVGIEMCFRHESSTNPLQMNYSIYWKTFLPPCLVFARCSPLIQH